MPPRAAGRRSHRGRSADLRQRIAGCFATVPGSRKTAPPVAPIARPVAVIAAMSAEAGRSRRAGCGRCASGAVRPAPRRGRARGGAGPYVAAHAARPEPGACHVMHGLGRNREAGNIPVGAAKLDLLIRDGTAVDENRAPFRVVEKQGDVAADQIGGLPARAPRGDTKLNRASASVSQAKSLEISTRSL